MPLFSLAYLALLAVPAAFASDLEERWHAPGKCGSSSLRWNPDTKKCYSPAKHPSWDNCAWLNQCYNPYQGSCYDCKSKCNKGYFYDCSAEKCKPHQRPSTEVCWKQHGQCYSKGKCVDCQSSSEKGECKHGYWPTPKGCCNSQGCYGKPCKPPKKVCNTCPQGTCDNNGQCCTYDGRKKCTACPVSPVSTSQRTSTSSMSSSTSNTSTSSLMTTPSLTTSSTTSMTSTTTTTTTSSSTTTTMSTTASTTTTSSTPGPSASGLLHRLRTRQRRSNSIGEMFRARKALLARRMMEMDE